MVFFYKKNSLLNVALASFCMKKKYAQKLNKLKLFYSKSNFLINYFRIIIIFINFSNKPAL